MARSARCNQRMGIRTRARAAVAVARKDGVRAFARYTAHRFVEGCYERWLGIDTGGHISLESLGIFDEESVMYAASSYPAFFRSMKIVPVDYRRSTFIDFGSGLGRVVMSAATFPFKRVIGVEISEQLTRRAQQNIERGRRRIRCGSLQLLTMNATQMRIPDDATVFHLYNPFRKRTLFAVVSAISRSLQECPRTSWILFAYPWEMDGLMRGGQVIPLAWQVGSQDIPWPFHDDLDPNGHRYRIYSLDSRVGRSAGDAECPAQSQGM